MALDKIKEKLQKDTTPLETQEKLTRSADKLENADGISLYSGFYETTEKLKRVSTASEVDQIKAQADEYKELIPISSMTAEEKQIILSMHADVKKVIADKEKMMMQLAKIEAKGAVSHKDGHYRTIAAVAAASVSPMLGAAVAGAGKALGGAGKGVTAGVNVIRDKKKRNLQSKLGVPAGNQTNYPRNVTPTESPVTQGPNVGIMSGPSIVSDPKQNTLLESIEEKQDMTVEKLTRILSIHEMNAKRMAGQSLDNIENKREGERGTKLAGFKGLAGSGEEDKKKGLLGRLTENLSLFDVGLASMLGAGGVLSLLKGGLNGVVSAAGSFISGFTSILSKFKLPAMLGGTTPTDLAPGAKTTDTPDKKTDKKNRRGRNSPGKVTQAAKQVAQKSKGVARLVGRALSRVNPVIAAAATGAAIGTGSYKLFGDTEIFKDGSDTVFDFLTGTKRDSEGAVIPKQQLAAQADAANKRESDGAAIKATQTANIIDAGTNIGGSSVVNNNQSTTNVIHTGPNSEADKLNIEAAAFGMH